MEPMNKQIEVVRTGRLTYWVQTTTPAEKAVKAGKSRRCANLRWLAGEVLEKSRQCITYPKNYPLGQEPPCLIELRKNANTTLMDLLKICKDEVLKAAPMKVRLVAATGKHQDRIEKNFDPKFGGRWHKDLPDDALVPRRRSIGHFQTLAKAFVARGKEPGKLLVFFGPDGEDQWLKSQEVTK